MRNILLLIIGGLFSFTVNALGLGGMTVYSDLSQPMNAEIELVGVSSDELAELNIGIALPDVFKQNGVPYTHSLQQLAFAASDTT